MRIRKKKRTFRYSHRYSIPAYRDVEISSRLGRLDDVLLMRNLEEAF